MAEEEKSPKVVETYKAVAAGLAATLAAVFTSRLGVAGTLIGTALTAVIITLGSAVLKAQLMKATTKISGLPDTVRGRLSTQQVRIPGRPDPEPEPLPDAAERSPGLLSRLRTAPGFLKNLPSNQRRRLLLAGVPAALVAAVIGISAVTGIEAVAGETLSCLVWSCEEEDSASSSGRSSGLSILGGRPSGTAPTDAPPDGSEATPPAPDEVPQTPEEGPPARPNANGAGGAGGAAEDESAPPPPPPPEEADPERPGAEEPNAGGEPPPPEEAPKGKQGRTGKEGAPEGEQGRVGEAPPGYE